MTIKIVTKFFAAYSTISRAVVERNLMIRATN